MANEPTDRLSWLSGTEVLRLFDSDRDATITVFDLTEMPDIPGSDQDIRHVFRAAERIDTIANAYYGSPKYWWVIALANGIDLPSAELVPGAVLTIPAPATVQSLIGRR